jgi:hypothetical protein
MTKIAPNTINRLKFGRTAKGMVGCQVKPTGQNQNNMAWLTVIAKKSADCTVEPTPYHFINYEVEYLELREGYDENLHGFDYDRFYVKKETYFNIKTEEELETLLSAWIDDFSVLTHIGNTNHPYY